MVFILKEAIRLNGITRSIVMYMMLINSLLKLEKYDEAECLLKKISNKGLLPNEVLYNTILYCRCSAGNILKALKVNETKTGLHMYPGSFSSNVCIVYKFSFCLCTTSYSGHDTKVFEVSCVGPI